MTKPKDMEDYFRNRREDFNEVPSRAAWKKLDRRLNAHQKRNRLSFTRSFTMVAAVLLLVVFAFLFFMVEMGGPANQETASINVEPISTQDMDPEAYKVVEYTLKYRDRMSNIIEEGAEGNKLQVRHN
jgi:hypothetical protein